MVSNGGNPPTDLKNTEPASVELGQIQKVEQERVQVGGLGGDEKQQQQQCHHVVNKQIQDGEVSQKEIGQRVSAGLVVGALGGGDEKSEFHLWVSLVLLLWTVCGLAAYSKVLKILWDSNDFE